MISSYSFSFRSFHAINAKRNSPSKWLESERRNSFLPFFVILSRNSFHGTNNNERVSKKKKLFCLFRLTFRAMISASAAAAFIPLNSAQIANVIKLYDFSFGFGILSLLRHLIALSKASVRRFIIFYFIFLDVY